jgi:hypothetical protein
VVEALGIMSQILTKEKLEGLLPVLVPGMLSLYKKHPGDILPITNVSSSLTAVTRVFFPPWCQTITLCCFPSPFFSGMLCWWRRACVP